MLAKRFIPLLLALAFTAACKADSKDDCTLADNKTTTVTVDYGKALPLKPKLCSVKNAAEVSYEWSLNQELVSKADTYRFLACPRFKGTKTSVNVNLTYGASKASHTWNVFVRDVAPKYKDCGVLLTPKDAIAALQKGDFFGTETNIDFKTAVACLDEALVDYPCDIDVAFWAAYGDLLLFAQRAPTSFLVSGLSEKTLNTLVDETIDPILGRFDLLAAEMPDEFTAKPRDFPFTPIGLNELEIHPGGDWDRGDMYFIDGAFQLFKGVSKFAAAYVGSVKFAQMGALTGILNALSNGNPAAISPELQDQLITELDKDPNFLTLFPGDQGKERLAASRTALLIGLQRINEAVNFVKSETDDQRDDIFRYFDCGADSICPPEESRDSVRGDAGERILKDEGRPGKFDEATDTYLDSNGNGQYDAPWRIAGADNGEADGQYSEGETMGTDAFSGLITRIGFPVKPLTQDFLADLAQNIKGPKSLDLVKYTPLAQNSIIQYSVLSGINIPMLRLSKWFEGPRDIRDFLPLWSHKNRRFITDSEEEAWDDWGYDKKLNSLEDATAPTCPGRDALLNLKDPAGDDFAPTTNSNDGCDNDRDGQVDESDGFGRSKDYGQEGNRIFDYEDTNLNNRHDPGELSENWSDTGLKTATQTPVGAGNGRWDAADMAHYWPKGGDVGGRSVEITKDPRNAALQDGVKPLVDPIYYFFPDAQFNGVIIFEKPTVNADNIVLTYNAELMRFVSKLVQSSRSFIK
jgi:hypothetical protein